MRERRALRQFTLSTGKSAGRNSSGRLTLFHRGGGSKRLQRRIDLKRSTSSMGIVERIEYDPNRSSRIAPVRWKGWAHQIKCNTIELRRKRDSNLPRPPSPPFSRSLSSELFNLENCFFCFFSCTEQEFPYIYYMRTFVLCWSLPLPAYICNPRVQAQCN